MVNEDIKIRQLLKKFMDGNTSVEEERNIGRWFREHPSADRDLENYRTMFEWFDEGMPVDKDNNSILPLANDVPGNRHMPKFWVAIAVAASAAIVLGFVFFSNGSHRQESLPASKPSVALISVKDTVRKANAVQANDNKQQINTDTIKPQINQKVRRTGRKPHRLKFEPAPPPTLYAHDKTSRHSSDEYSPDNVAEQIESGDFSSVTEQTEFIINAALEEIDREQQQALNIYNLQNDVLEQAILSAIENDEDEYYDEDVW